MNALNNPGQSSSECDHDIYGGLGLRQEIYNAPMSRMEVTAVYIGDSKPHTTRGISIHVYPTGDCCRSMSPLNKNGPATCDSSVT